jgi:hypothetical protein
MGSRLRSESGCWAQGRPRSALNEIGYGLGIKGGEVGFGLGLKGCGWLWLTWGSRLRLALTYGLKAKVCYSLAAGLKEGHGRL